ncbi:MAG TPA: vitamin K epoxide reductase family protein [Ktedonobacterales bacterium]|nr:vitamin K epoxide reductase family protein [Ktedonobacterales bacterium]
MATLANAPDQQALPAPMASKASAQADIPPGWSYNPSAWRDRRWLIALAVIGFAAAAYTALGQFGVVTLWDPFFGSHSSYLVTHSAIERILPVPDGALGVVGYIADLVLGASGGADRWRRRPWLTLLFALTILGLGVVSLALTILQGVLVQQWCTVCLVSAAASTLIFGLGIGEALASLQLLARAHAAGRSAWQAMCGFEK